ncbi:Peptidase M17 leucyl aminopeptidase C-terminal [Trinorchestia longiramus]|nr:Peptidase M17 leucyl aminopeptidase C-terminal [Trinorchestia longiramus]
MQSFRDEGLSSSLANGIPVLLKIRTGGPLKAGAGRVLYGVSSTHPVVCAVGLGSRGVGGECVAELRDERKEAVRSAVAAGYRSLSETGVSEVAVDPCDDTVAAAEGAVLASFIYQALKSKKKDRPAVQSALPPDNEWKRGEALARGQNFARELMETPANHLTPTIFAQRAKESLERLGVAVIPHDQAWAEQQKMGAFLSVTRGSEEPPVFLELHYQGAPQQQQHLALVGKGVTFDTGGISLKPPKGMEAMRADMGGAACVVGAMQAIAELQLPLNVRAYIPLCENMPSGSATKPGDVVTAANGKTIQVDNTDAEGRLILADALHYASQAGPRALIDLATLTGAMRVALGGGAAGAFSNSDALWRAVRAAGSHTGDRVWRMPLWQVYSKQVTGGCLADLNNQAKNKPRGAACCAASFLQVNVSSPQHVTDEHQALLSTDEHQAPLTGTKHQHGLADVHNIGKYDSGAGACTAAAFLQQFVTCDHWMHLDIAGVMENSDEVPYLSKGMSGRPTRTLVHFASLLADGKTEL